MKTLPKEIQLLIIKEAIRLLNEAILDKDDHFSLCRIFDDAFNNVRYDNGGIVYNALTDFRNDLVGTTLNEIQAIKHSGRYSVPLLNYEEALNFLIDNNLPKHDNASRAGFWFKKDDYMIRMQFLQHIKYKLIIQ